MIATILLALPVVVYLATQLRKGQDFAALPSLVSVIFLLWIAPQLYFVQVQEGGLFWGTTLYGLFGGLCFVSLSVGFRFGTRRHVLAPFAANAAQITTLAIIFWSVISIYLNMKYIATIDANRAISQWSGSGTIIAFFASIRYVVFAVSAIVFFRRPGAVLGAFFAVNLYIMVTIAFGELRRSDVVALMLILFLVYFFVRGRWPPLGFFAITAPVVIVIVFGISELRTLQKAAITEGGSALDVLFNASLKSVDFGTALRDSMAFAPDVRNGSYIIQYCLETFEYRFGAEVWNDMVWQYVPAQLVGASFKQALVIGDRVSIYGDLVGYFNYFRSPGSTRTGIGAAFLDFGILGAFYFFVIGLICGRVFARAIAGDPLAQGFYVALLAPVLISFTHSHSYFFTLLPLLWLTKMGIAGACRFRIGSKGNYRVARPNGYAP